MNHNTSLYMFAFMPPAELAKRLDLMRVEFSELFKFYKGLKPPVHITLYEPFQMLNEKTSTFEAYIAKLQEWASFQHPFKVDLRDFNFFNNPKHPVVYVDVLKSKAIKNFHAGFINELGKFHLQGIGRSYTPHITIGYRDVTPEAFPGIKDYYSRQTFSSSFVCNTFYLWKHDGTNWQVIKTFYLDGRSDQLTLF